MTGERDYRVPYTQSLHFFTDLQLMKVPSRLIVLPNAGHWPGWYEMAFYYLAHLDWFHDLARRRRRRRGMSSASCAIRSSTRVVPCGAPPPEGAGSD